MDLHITSLLVRENGQTMVDPTNQTVINSSFDLQELLPGIIKPQERVLLSTEETVELRERTCGLIFLRSTWARLGFMSPTTIVDPGFKGTLTMSLFNCSSHSIILRPRESIWSLVILPVLDESLLLYSGRYQGQMELQLPKEVE
jgi:deoxycytidine triphosphate deaminase